MSFNFMLMVLDSRFNPIVDIFWQLFIKIYIKISKKLKVIMLTDAFLPLKYQF